jgi:hypothetical protein
MSFGHLLLLILKKFFSDSLSIFNQVIHFFLLSCVCFLFILSIIYLSDTWFSIFSPNSCDAFSFSWMFLLLCRRFEFDVTLHIYFCFCSMFFWCSFWKHCFQDAFPYLFLRSCLLLGIMFRYLNYFSWFFILVYFFFLFPFDCFILFSPFLLQWLWSFKLHFCYFMLPLLFQSSWYKCNSINQSYN